MRRVSKVAVGLFLLLCIPLTAFGQPDPNTILTNFVNELITPAVALLWLAGVGYFVFGFVMFLGDPTNPEKRQKGKQHMIWGTIGMFFLLSATAIVIFLRNVGGEFFPG